MEALIAKAVPALIDVLANQEFETCEKITDTLVEFERSNNPILEFFSDLDEPDYLNEPIKVVYQRYCTFCMANNMQAMSAIEFQKQMKKQYDLVIKTVELNDKKVRIYTNE